MKLNHKAVGLAFILKRKTIGTNHPLFALCDCYCFFIFKKKQTKQAKLNFSTNVLTPVKQ